MDIIKDLRIEEENRGNIKKNSINLKNLNSNERKLFLNSFDIIFCDCDGVLWTTMLKSIPNIVKGINFFKDNGKKIIYVTNNSIKSTEDQIKKFEENFIQINKKDLIHPIQTIIDYLKEINFNDLIYVIANQPAKMALIESGFKIIDGPNEAIEETFHDLAKFLFDNQNVKAIIIDVDFNLSVGKLIKAHLYLKKNPECLFLAGAYDMLIPFGNTEIIGPGEFIKILEHTTNRIPKIFGKPGADLAKMLNKRFNIKNEISSKRILFIGDSIEADINFANNLGYQTLLVLTGSMTMEKLNDLQNSDDIPDYYIDSIAGFEDFI